LIRARPLRSQEQPARANSIFKTWTSLFGTAYFGPHENANEKNGESIRNIQRMRDDLKQLRHAVLDPDTFHSDIWCRMRYLEAHPNVHNGRFQFTFKLHSDFQHRLSILTAAVYCIARWDSRPFEVGGARWVSWRQDRTCESGRVEAVTIPHIVLNQPPYPTTMVFCDILFSSTLRRPSLARRLPELFQENWITDNPAEKVHLRDLSRNNIAFVVMHELGHGDGWLASKLALRTSISLLLLLPMLNAV
jgi:hypothetical protein